MYPVSSVNLSPDGTQASSSYGLAELGTLSTDELVVLLERFQTVDPAQNLEFEPHLMIVGHSGRFQVRTGQGRLYLYKARTTVEPYAELSAREIIEQLERDTVTTAPFPGGGESSAVTEARAPRAQPAPHRGIAATILAAGLALNGYTLYSVLYTASVNDRPPVTLLTDSSEISARTRELAGIYATGERPGDRVIEVKPDGQVRFAEIALRGTISENTDRYQLARRGAKLCLSTIDSGIVDVANPETLVYYKDSYRKKLDAK